MVQTSPWKRPPHRVRLRGVFLRRTDWSGARLVEADLSGSDLSNANLAGADLRGAKLDRTILRGADLRGAENLTAEQIDAAVIDETTRLPSYLDRPVLAATVAVG